MLCHHVVRSECVQNVFIVLFVFFYIIIVDLEINSFIVLGLAFEVNNIVPMI